MRIGKYHVVREVGAGGMGIVYHAVDRELNRSVAIKMIGSHANIRATVHANTNLGRAAALDMNRRMMLVREARIATDLRHPNIVRVFDYGQHAGLLYIVMEYLEGQSLNRIIPARNTFTMSYKIGMIAEICDALGFAHARGVIHRDIKPANTFVLKNGRVKVLDFGLAAKLAEPLPGRPAFVGTPNYAAPEVVQRKTRHDAKVDIWATGVALYELLAGVPPFAGRSVIETFYKICNDPLPPLPEDLAEPDAVSEILIRALAKNPNSRYASAEDFSNDLRRLQEKLQNTEAAPLKLSSAESAAPDRSTFYLPEPGFEIGLEKSDSKVTISSRQNSFRRIALSVRFRQPSALNSEQPPGVRLGLDVFTVFVLMAVWRFLTFIPLVLLEKLADVPRCQNCRSWMQRKTRWTRYANTEAALRHGFDDCVAALKHNLWEDAAKLLSIHGDDYSPSITNSIVSPPIRYHLDFFECYSCGGQSARVTVEDKDQDNWAARPQSTNAYKSPAPNRSRRSRGMGWLALIGAVGDAATTVFQGFAPAFRTIMLVFCALGLFVLGLYLVRVMVALK